METRIYLYGEMRQPLPASAPEIAASLEDGALVEAAKEGDRAAFGRLYDRYARLVHGILLARVPRNEVDDLVQDVFLLALRRLKTLRDQEAFGPWISAIARNRATDFFRRASLHSALLRDSGGDKPASAGDTQQAYATAALSAIRSLPDAYREALILRLVEGMTGPEIAARTGLTPGSVRVNLCRGMQLLRERLGIRTATARD